MTAWLTRCAGTLAGLRGWRRYAVATLLGSLATATLPPLHLLPVLLVVFPALVWLVDCSRTRRAAFAAGWWFGFGYFLIGLYWISNALLTDPARFGWMLPFAAVGLPIGLAVFTGLATLGYRLSRATGWGRAPAFAAIWVALEWLRGHALTGFPWNLAGYAWTVSDSMLQATAGIGIYGLTLITVAVSVLPAAVPDAGSSSDRRRWWPALIGLLVLAAVWGGGAFRLAGAAPGTVDGVTLRIVQGNIPQRLKWRPERAAEHFRRYIDLTTSPGSVTHVIWPETAAAFFLNEQPEARAVMAGATPPGGMILTGAPRVRRDDDKRMRQVWNSLYAIDTAGAVVGIYDKYHLVPFGEYMPLRGLLNLAKLTEGSIDFSPGPGPETLDLPGLPAVGPLICYEAIFPGAVVDPARRPAWLLNITNDAWYGRSAGPYQHLAITRVRAVEEGLPLVRAAGTGISAVIDSYGRVTDRLGLDRAGVIDAPLPRALTERTIYGRWGDLTLLPLLLGCVLLAWVGRRGESA